jgi:glycosyltransferase involved in cell wall biosynthesis
MRVVHIIKVIRVAGAEQHLLRLLPGLRGQNVDAQMILLIEPTNDMAHYVRALEEQHIPVRRMVIHRHADVMLIKRLRGELRTLQPDIVHTHLIHADLFGILAARWAGVPVIVTSRHNDDAFRSRQPIKFVNQVLWRMADAGIAISNSIERFSIQVEGAPASKLHRIYYGLDTSIKPLDRNTTRPALEKELGLAGDAILVGMVCRLIEQKGVRYGLQAFQQIAAEFPTARLLIAGEGPLRAELEACAAQAGLTKRVHFLGWRADVPALLSALDVLLAPSLWEGFGLVLLEAMSQQTPVVASAVSAIPEVISSGDSGLLVPPRDVDGLAGALRQLLSDKPLRQYMGLVGRDRLETHFSAAHMVDQTLALYHTLLDGL